MTTYIKFDVSVYRWSTGGYDPDDEWSRDSTDGVVSIIGATITSKDGYDTLGTDAELKKGDTIYLVWAQYSTGDTFGNDGGQYELLEVHTDKAVADARREMYENLGDNRSEDVGQCVGYVPWLGYFESLDFVQVDEFVL